jgi:cytochrome c biogenesis protein CcmG/thiol:disulfide interchange protein DsbE
MRDALQKIDRLKGFWLALVLVLLCGTSVRADDSLDLSEYHGKVVLLDFWASWCVPCRRSFPWMNEMQQKYGDSGLVIIGVNMDAEPEAAQGFLDDYPANFKIISAPDGALAKEYGVIAMPSSFVIGRDGEVVIKHLGFKVKKQDEYEAGLVNVLRTGTE